MWQLVFVVLGLVLPLASVTGAAAGTEGQISYTVERQGPGTLQAYPPDQIALLEKLNRADARHLRKLKSIVIPDNFELDEKAYTTLPVQSDDFADQPKFLVIYLPAQMFGAYEHGALVRWGPISSGSRRSQTPTGLFRLNWKARRCCSTVNPSWIMTWYFNFENRGGLALHAYTLPGIPASHGCVRLLERDAIWLYHWGETWQLSSDETTVTRTGTPVLIMGKYDFDRPRPWLDGNFYNNTIDLSSSR